ncbi:MAG: conserved membrane protein of unknown function [Methanothrix sp.]|jgi:hypothetical protein|nr:MAG: conserved membrane protein of unknown function [Methanothrix sp.]
MMTDYSIKTGKGLGIYASALGAISLVVGLVEISGGWGEIIPGDLFGGFVLLVIAATYLNGVKGVFQGRYEGLSFLVGGLFLTAVFGILYLLMMGAEGLMYLLGEAQALPGIFDLRPEVWILLLSLPLARRVRRLTDGMAW